jgi:hypothetical protein
MKKSIFIKNDGIGFDIDIENDEIDKKVIYEIEIKKREKRIEKKF